MVFEIPKQNYGGFGKAIGIVALTLVAGALGAVLGHTVGTAIEIEPVFFEGAAGGAVLGAFIYHHIRGLRNTSPLVDATSLDRIQFDESRAARVTHPPHEKEEHKVFAVETNPDGDYPFKVWVADESGKEQHPYYATAVEFVED